MTEQFQTILNFFLSGSLIAYCVILALFLIGALLDYRSWHKMSLVFTATTVGLVLYINNIDLVWLIPALVLSIAFGICWSVARWKIRVNAAKLKTRRLVESIDESSEADTYYVDNRYEELKNSISFIRNIDVILCWVFSWPASMVGSLIGATYDKIELIIREKLGGLYSRISEQGLADMDEIMKESTHSKKTVHRH